MSSPLHHLRDIRIKPQRDTLLTIEECKVTNLNEFSLRELVDLVTDGFCKPKRKIWLTPKAFIYGSGATNYKVGNTRFFIMLGFDFLGMPSSYRQLYFFGDTYEDALHAADLVLALQGFHCERINVYEKYDSLFASHRISHLAKILSSARKKCHFECARFSEDQSQMLAKTDILLSFDRCTFSDGGASFVDAFARSEGTEELRFCSLPFDENHWMTFLDATNTRPLKSLDLSGLYDDLLLTDEALQRMTPNGIQTLKLSCCKLSNQGRSIIQSVGAGDSFPRGLQFCGLNQQTRTLFETEENWSAFVDAIGSSTCRLERLEIQYLPFGQQTLPRLISALKHNRSLSEITLKNIPMTKSSWDLLIDALRSHPSLCRVSIATMKFRQDYRRDPENSEYRTMSMAGLLTDNARIEEIIFDDGTFSKTLWEEHVGPKLECNIYTKRVLELQQEKDLCQRSRLLGEAMVRARAKTNGLWILLSRNPDILSR